MSDKTYGATNATRTLVVGAIMLALATVLSVFAVYKLPNGGSVTIASMVPLILFSLMFDIKRSALVTVAYALLQMLLGFYPPPVQDIWSFVLVVALDYVIAFGVLCFAGSISRFFGRFIGNRLVTSLLGGGIVIIGRFVCHFLSGITVWQTYAPPDVPVWLFSFLYNGSYMLCEFIISLVVLAILYPVIKRFAPAGAKQA